MFNLVLSDMSIEPKRIDSLDKQADSEITIQRYELDILGVSPELGKELFCQLRRLLGCAFIITRKKGVSQCFA